MSQNEKITVPSAAPDLVQRLSAALELRLTLTDNLGTVLASTDDHPRGHIEPTALAVLRAGTAVEREGVASAQPTPEDLDSPDPTISGLLASGPGVYLPLLVNGRVDGVLIAHGPPDEVRVPARTAAAAAGLTLEFARGASVSARQGMAPDIALHQLLRGSAPEARRAAVVAKVMGWDLTVPRVAMAIVAREVEGAAGGLGTDQYAMITKFVDLVAPGTPYAQLDLTEWVLLPELSPLPERPSPWQLAEDVRTGLLQAGVSAALGIGETHAERSLPALRRSYREAVYAARCGARTRGETGVYALRDLGAAAFLVPSPATRRRLADRIVQPLRAEPGLLQSLRAFLDSNCSFASAAESTGLHRHTIRNHLQRVHELSGLDPRAVDDALQLRLALLIESDPLPQR